MQFGARKGGDDQLQPVPPRPVVNLRGMPVRSCSDEPGQVLQFRPPRVSAESGKPAEDVSGTNVIRLLDLSKYEKPKETTVEFKARMRENIAALIVLGLLVGIAATDFTDIEQAQQCASVRDCRH